MTEGVDVHPVKQLAAKLKALHCGKSIDVALLTHAHKIPRRFDPHVYPFSLLEKEQHTLVENFYKRRVMRRCSIAGCPKQHRGFKDIIVRWSLISSPTFETIWISLSIALLTALRVHVFDLYNVGNKIWKISAGTSRSWPFEENHPLVSLLYGSFWQDWQLQKTFLQVSFERYLCETLALGRTGVDVDAQGVFWLYFPRFSSKEAFTQEMQSKFVAKRIFWSGDVPDRV